MWQIVIQTCKRSYKLSSLPPSLLLLPFNIQVSSPLLSLSFSSSAEKAYCLTIETTSSSCVPTTSQSKRCEQ